LVEAIPGPIRGWRSAGSALFFSVYTEATGWELWVSDGTPEGTRMVHDLNPGPMDGVGAPAVAELNGDIYFAGTDGVSGSELFRLADFIVPGDADGDGRITAADYFAIDRGRATRRSGFHNGDFDSSGGAADADDYMIIDRAFLAQPAMSTAAPARPAAGAQSPPQLFPEAPDEPDLWPWPPLLA
jgi:ELWxxDGT repeat protein